MKKTKERGYSEGYIYTLYNSMHPFIVLAEKNSLLKSYTMHLNNGPFPHPFIEGVRFRCFEVKEVLRYMRL